MRGDQVPERLLSTVSTLIGLLGGVVVFAQGLRRFQMSTLQVLKGLLGKGHDIPVAIKAVHENTSSSQRKSLLQEITLLRNLRHSNIVTLFGACQEVGCQTLKHNPCLYTHEYIYSR